MKKFFLFIVSLFAFASTAMAQGPKFTVEDLIVKDGTGTVTVKFEFDKDDYYGNFQFDILFPDEVTADIGRGKVKYPNLQEAGFAVAANVWVVNTEGDINYGKKVVRFLGSCNDGYAIVGTSGTILTFPVSVNASLNETFNATLNNGKINSSAFWSDGTDNPDCGKVFILPDVDFNVMAGTAGGDDQQVNTLVGEDATGRVGSTASLPITLNNTSIIQGLQFDLYLPEGVTVAKKNERSFDVTMNEERAYDFTVSGEQKGDGHYRFVCTSQETADGNTGNIMTINLQLSKDMTEGEYNIYLRDIELSDELGNALHAEDTQSKLIVEPLLTGDANGDGIVSVSDVTTVINHILKKPVSYFSQRAADVNNDNIINITDITGIINIILNK